MTVECRFAQLVKDKKRELAEKMHGEAIVICGKCGASADLESQCSRNHKYVVVGYHDTENCESNGN